ncbi:sulfurtransferase complex subunit TusD [Thalassotalea ganghwensis]
MTQQLALVVTTPPHVNLTHTAYQLALAAAQAHQLISVFFYQQGVLNAAKHLRVPADEYQQISVWQQLCKDYNVPLHLCATAAEKFGLIDVNDDYANIHSEFILSGLGELVKLSTQADKVIQL